MRTRALHAGRGLLIGCAEVVPGVSGGTIALIVGVYERLLGSIRAALAIALALVGLDRAGARTAARQIDLKLVVPLLVGMAVAVLVGARIIPPLLERYPAETSALFFGLILASLAVPWRMWINRRPFHFLVVVAGAAIAVVLTGLPPGEIADPAPPLVFGAAALAICALVLPGVSGSYLLLAMGLYAPTLEAVATPDIGYLGVFAAGALVGLGLFARVLTRLLRDHRDVTLAALLGLMVGSLRALWPWSGEQGALLPPPDEAAVAPAVGMALLGLALVTVLLIATRERELGPNT